MEFKDTYTTESKIMKESWDTTIKDKIETSKIIISEECFALGDIIDKLKNSIDRTRESWLR